MSVSQSFKFSANVLGRFTREQDFEPIFEDAPGKGISRTVMLARAKIIIVMKRAVDCYSKRQSDGNSKNSTNKEPSN